MTYELSKVIVTVRLDLKNEVIDKVFIENILPEASGLNLQEEIISILKSSFHILS